MKRVASLMCAAVFLALSAAAPSPLPVAMPRVTLTVDKPQFLSTETAQGSLEIENTTGENIGYYPNENFFYILRDANGQQYERLRWMSITHIIAPQLKWLAPNEKVSFSVELPNCEVISDPCTERVAIKFTIVTAAKQGSAIQTNEQAYTFVADPSVTFVINGLKGNRPLFLARGQASGAVLQDHPVVKLHFASPPPTNLDKMVDDVATRYALSVDESGSDDNDWSFYGFAAQQPDSIPESSSVNRLAQDLKQQLGARLDRMTVYYQPKDDALDPILGAASDSAKQDAEILAAFTRAGQLSTGYGLVGDGTFVQFTMPGDDNRDAPYFPTSQLSSNADALAAQQSNAPASLAVRVQATTAFVGQNPISSSQTSGLNLPSASSPQLNGLEMPVHAVIAADRPEIFAVAAATRQAADRAGYLADAVALSLARRRAASFARDLGVAAGYVSLVAQYGDISLSSDTMLLPYGVALTMSNESQARWHRLAAAGSLRPPEPRRPIPIPIPTLLSSPRPMAIMMRPQPSASGFMALQVNPNWGYWQQPVQPLAPIDAQEPATLLRALGDVSENVTASALRVSIVVDAVSPDKAAPNASTIVASLLAQPFLKSATFEERSPNSFPIGYDFVIQTREANQVERVIGLLRSAYAGFNSEMKFGVVPMLTNCDAAVARVQTRSADSAARLAVSAARDSRRTLRRLILAVAYPPDAGDACLPVAFNRALEWASDSQLRMPGDYSVKVRAPVLLVFRTTQPRM